jgi:hypothetical protein
MIAMGGDFYIIKRLDIVYNDNETTYIDVSKSAGYFIHIDSDDEEESRASYLRVTYQPRTLYKEGEWVSLHCREMYERLVMKEIGSDGKLHRVTKREIRYARA